MHKRYRKYKQFYLTYNARMSELYIDDIIFEQEDDTAGEKTIKVANKIREVVGEALQSPCTGSMCLCLYALGRMQKTEKLFSFIGKNYKHIHALVNTIFGFSSGTSTGAASGGGAGAAGGTIVPGAGNAVGAAGGATAGGAGGATAGTGFGAWIGMFTRKHAGKIAKYLGQFLGSCNDYIGDKGGGKFIKLLKKKLGFKENDDDKEDFGVDLDEESVNFYDNPTDEEIDRFLEDLEMLDAYRSGLIQEGLFDPIGKGLKKAKDIAAKAGNKVKEKVKEKAKAGWDAVKDNLEKNFNKLINNAKFLMSVIEKYLNKLISFFTELIWPIVKTLFYMLKFAIKNYKKFWKAASTQEIVGLIREGYDKAASEAGLKATDSWDPKAICDYFMSWDVVINTMADMMRLIIEKIKWLIGKLKAAGQTIVDIFKVGTPEGTKPIKEGEEEKKAEA